jgi:hypothetical protein
MKKKKDNKIIFFLIAGALLWFAFKPKKKPVQQILKEAFNNLDFEFKTRSHTFAHHKIKWFLSSAG